MHIKGKKSKVHRKLAPAMKKRETKILFSNNMSPPKREYLTLPPCLCLKPSDNEVNYPRIITSGNFPFKYSE